MITTTLSPAGELTLPENVRQKYGLKPDSEVRIVETSQGILLVPTSNEPPSAELMEELHAWQELSIRSWSMFPYEEESGD